MTRSVIAVFVACALGVGCDRKPHQAPPPRVEQPAKADPPMASKRHASHEHEHGPHPHPRHEHHHHPHPHPHLDGPAKHHHPY